MDNNFKFFFQIAIKWKGQPPIAGSPITAMAFGKNENAANVKMALDRENVQVIFKGILISY